MASIFDRPSVLTGRALPLLAVYIKPARVFRAAAGPWPVVDSTDENRVFHPSLFVVNTFVTRGW